MTANVWFAAKTTPGKARQHDCVALVLQGGGALGAYQAGVYEELSSQAYQPNWIAGVSIGAINAALIAGNPPERRIDRLSEFWHLVSSGMGTTTDMWSTSPWLKAASEIPSIRTGSMVERVLEHAGNRTVVFGGEE
jgi:predicted acylesterase/phospholipase RssA